MLFPPPETSKFYDNRVLISWEISQPKNCGVLRQLKFEISGTPNLVFEPEQNPIIELPTLEGNIVILNWVIKQPEVTTKISLSMESSTIKETQKITLTP
ncbi:MAG: hypothetical protein ACW97Z_02215 [Candidatus Hodarchaeales archaeon]|jgi:hypothetical protein